MSDAAAAISAAHVVAVDAKAKSSPKKKAAGKTSAVKKPADHPKYSEMVKQALASLKERGGSSRQAVLKYIMKNFKVGSDENVVNTHLKMALRAGVKNSSLKQSKGSGAAGSFRLGEEAKKKPVAAKAKTVKAKKPKSPAKAKKPAKAKTAKSPAKKSAAAAKKPKTAAAKPKKAKSDKPKKAATPKKVVKSAAPKKTSSPVKKAKPAAPKKVAKPKKVATKKAAPAKKA
jgi:histone H1/5